jgi:hypothetical protein
MAHLRSSYMRPDTYAGKRLAYQRPDNYVDKRPDNQRSSATVVRALVAVGAD